MSREVKVINSVFVFNACKECKKSLFFWVSFSLSFSFFGFVFLSLVGKWESRTHHAQMFFLYGSGIDFCLFVYLLIFCLITITKLLFFLGFVYSIVSLSIRH